MVYIVYYFVNISMYSSVVLSLSLLLIFFYLSLLVAVNIIEITLLLLGWSTPQTTPITSFAMMIRVVIDQSINYCFRWFILVFVFVYHSFILHFTTALPLHYFLVENYTGEGAMRRTTIESDCYYMYLLPLFQLW